jgi:hypothetical protein
MNKKCPHCDQPLGEAAFKCSRCKEWVPNELFNRLCDEDVKLIKKNDLTLLTPSLMAVMVLSLLKDSHLEKRLQEMPGRNLNGLEQFNLYVFWSFSYFAAVRLSVKMKQSCKDAIMATLKDKLLTGIIEFYGVEISGIEHEKTTHIQRVEGQGLYDKFDIIWNDLGTDTQVNTSLALASAVFGDKQAGIFKGLPLYMEFVDTPVLMQEEFKSIFLVEEKDFDWQTMIGC